MTALKILQVSDVPVRIESAGALTGYIRWSSLPNPDPDERNDWTQWQDSSHLPGKIARFIQYVETV